MGSLRMFVTWYDRIHGKGPASRICSQDILLRNCHEARSEPVLLVYCISWCTLLFVVESGMCLLATRLQGGYLKDFSFFVFFCFGIG